MPPRGRKPKPTHLKVMTGNPGKRALPDNEPETVGELVKPKFLGRKRAASKLWDEVAPVLAWLGEADSRTLAVWCVLQAEFERDARNMTASRIGQMRALAAELGMTPSARTRVGGGKKQEQRDPAAKYLTKRSG